MSIRFIVFILILTILPVGCSNNEAGVYQGYVEGEFVYVASPLGGQLDRLGVRRGQSVEKGAFLFALDDTQEKAAADQAAQNLQQSRDTLADKQKGKRPSEIASYEAQLKNAQASLRLSKIEYNRRIRLLEDGSISQEERDQAKTQYEQDLQTVHRNKADLATAKLGSRDDEIRAAEAAVRASEAALTEALWAFNQKTQNAPRNGLIFDTIFYLGEWVPSGRPVISLLPPENIKVRFFVPEPVVGKLRRGQKVRVSFDGMNRTVGCSIDFISPQAEYTPPVIYSSQSRAKLVFMIEGRPSLEDASLLHPGQPVDVAVPELMPPKDMATP